MHDVFVFNFLFDTNLSVVQNLFQMNNGDFLQ